MELVNIWEDYIRISLGWKITTIGEKKASLQLSECFRYMILPDGFFLLVKTPRVSKATGHESTAGGKSSLVAWHGCQSISSKICIISGLNTFNENNTEKPATSVCSSTESALYSKEHAMTLGVNCIKLKLSRNYLKFSCRICSVVKISIFCELNWQLQAAFESTLPLLVCHFRKSIRYFPRRNNLRGKKDLPFLENTFILFCLLFGFTRLQTSLARSFPRISKHLGKCLCDSVCRLWFRERLVTWNEARHSYEPYAVRIFGLINWKCVI